MPDWSDLSREEIGAIVDYLAANGPEQKEPDERHASTASAAEIEAGRQLFQGQRALINGGTACHVCHSIDRRITSRSTTLGPDLSTAYFRFQDKGLTDYLKRPCMLREPETFARIYLTPQEAFELKAYLANAGNPPTARRGAL
jgi:mono/diheme cytochrome c family protein